MPKATLLLAALAAHAAPDDKLLAAARAAQPAVIESLREMVAIKSGTMDAPGIGKMADKTGSAGPGRAAGCRRCQQHQHDGQGPGYQIHRLDAIVPRLYISTRLLMDLGKGD